MFFRDETEKIKVYKIEFLFEKKMKIIIKFHKMSLMSFTIRSSHFTSTSFLKRNEFSVDFSTFTVTLRISE